MREMFAAGQASLARSALLPLPLPGRSASELAASAKRDDAIAKAAATLAKARVDYLNTVKPAAGEDPAALALASAAQASTVWDAAQKAEAATRTTENANETGAANAAVLREARARVYWIGTLGTSLLAVVGTLVGAAWILAVAAADHLRPEGRRSQFSRGPLDLLALMAASTLCMLALWGAASLLLQATIFYGIAHPPIYGGNVLVAFDDAAAEWMFGGKDNHVPGNFLPGARPLTAAAESAAVLAVVALGAAVVATLYQQPEQVVSRRAGNAPDEVLKLRPAPRAVPDDDVLAYNRFLARCFQRLNVCIYIGATLTVLRVVHVSAKYGWMGASFDPGVTTEPGKSTLAAFQGLANEFTLEYGIIFTALLTSLFLPAWLILRARAWEAARAQNEAGTTETSLQTWLNEHGLSFRPIQQYAQVLTLLAPASAAMLLNIFKAVTGTG